MYLLCFIATLLLLPFLLPDFLFNIFAVPQRNTRVHFGNGIPFLLGLILTEKQGRSSIAGMVPVDGYSWAENQLR